MNTMFSLPRFVSSCLVLLVGLLLVPNAFAQATEQPAPPEPVEITDELLDAVAEAYVDVQLLNNKYEALFAEAESQEQATLIQAEAMNEITEAIESQGLTIGQYEGVIAQVQVDEELRGDLIQRINNVVEDRGLSS